METCESTMPPSFFICTMSIFGIGFVIGVVALIWMSITMLRGSGTSSSEGDYKLVRKIGRQTFLHRCYNCGERMHILERYKETSGGRRYRIVDFWVCQKCGEEKQPDPPPSAYGY